MLNTHSPLVDRDRYGWAEVVEIRGDLGVFVAIGLPDKDIVISLDDLPSDKNLWPHKGDKLLISLKSDRKERLWGELADEFLLAQIGRTVVKFERNEKVSGVVYRTKMIGDFILLDDFRLAFLHHSEYLEEPHLGQQIEGRVIGQTRDHRLSISLKPLAHEEISEDAQMVLAVLQQAPHGEIPYTDKSEPQAIKKYFGISKGAFKRALGHLLKQKLVEQLEGKTRLIRDSDQHE